MEKNNRLALGTFKTIKTTLSLYFNVWFQKISVLHPQKGLEIPWRSGVSRSQKFKAMYRLYEAKLEFLEGWGVIRQIPTMGGYGYLLEPQCDPNFSACGQQNFASWKSHLHY